MNINDIPNHVKKYTPTLQRQYTHVYDTVFKKVLQEINNTEIADKRAKDAAESVLSKRFTIKNNMKNNSHEDYFMYKIDKFLDE